MAPSTAGCRVTTRLLALVHLDRDARRGDQPLGSGGRRRVDGHAPGVEAVLQDEGGGDDRAAVDGQIVERRTRPGEAGQEHVEAGALLVVERRRRRAGEAGAEERPQRFARAPSGERGLVPQAFRVGAAHEAVQADRDGGMRSWCVTKSSPGSPLRPSRDRSTWLFTSSSERSSVISLLPLTAPEDTVYGDAPSR